MVEQVTSMQKPALKKIFHTKTSDFCQEFTKLSMAYLKIRLLVVSAKDVPEEGFGQYSVVASAPRVCGG